MPDDDIPAAWAERGGTIIRNTPGCSLVVQWRGRRNWDLKLLPDHASLNGTENLLVAVCEGAEWRTTRTTLPPADGSGNITRLADWRAGAFTLPKLLLEGKVPKATRPARWAGT